MTERLQMGGGFLILMVPVLMLMALVFTMVVVGIHALLLGRVPGRRLGWRVRQPRLWGAGVLLVSVGWTGRPPTLLVVGIGLVALGYVMKPER